MDYSLCRLRQGGEDGLMQLKERTGADIDMPTARAIYQSAFGGRKRNRLEYTTHLNSEEAGPS